MLAKRAGVSKTGALRSAEMIHVADSSDLVAISQLVNSAYRGDPSRLGWTTEADLLGGQRTDPHTLEESLRDPDAVVLFLRERGEIVACVYLKRRGETAYLGMLTVRPPLQSAGLGKRLLALAEDWVIENWHSRKIEMQVISKRLELIAWYERRGYALTGAREPFPVWRRSLRHT